MQSLPQISFPMLLHRATKRCSALPREISSARHTRPAFDKRNCKTSFCEVTLTKISASITAFFVKVHLHKNQ